MLRFENESLLWLLAIIPFMVLGYVLLHYSTQKSLKKYTNSTSLIQKLLPNQSRGMRHVKFTFLMLTLASLIVALANPQVGTSLEKGTRKGVDIMVCMDVSNSMLAQDYSPNRIEASKMAMNRFIDQLKGDRIGLIVFAGKAFVQLPITSDYAAAKMFINNVSPEMMAQQGTDMAAAIDLAVVSMLPETENGHLDANKLSQLQSKVMILVSDGEDHFEEAVEMARTAHELGIIIHTIGIGSTRGEPIPYRNDFMKDDEGNTVITKLNEQILKDVATAAGGVFVHATNANVGFEMILEKIDNMHKVDLQEVTFAKYESRYYYPLALALLLLLVETLLFVQQPKWKKWIRNMRNNLTMRKTSVVILLLMASATLQAQTLEEITAMRKGNSEYAAAEKLRTEAMQLLESDKETAQREANVKMNEASKKYQSAEKYYRKATEHTKNYTEAQYNLANTLYRQKKYEEAVELYKQLGGNQDLDKDSRAYAYHNLGNSFMKEEKYEESIDSYKNALKLDPTSKDTKYNLEYAKQKLIQQQQQQQQQNQDQKEDQEKQDQQQDKNQEQKDQQDQEQKEDQQKQQDKKEEKSPEQQKKEQQQQQQKEKDDKRQLDALQQNERQTQRKIQEKQMGTPVKGKQKKQW